MVDGLLDTNVFIHAHTTDHYADECRRFLATLEAGGARAYIDPLVLHELSYALPHYVQQMTRAQVGEYLLMVLSWEGIQGDKDLMVDAVERWRALAGLSFVDAYLAALARRRQAPVYTKNVRELAGQGVIVPEPLPVASDERRPRARRH